ncbi:MAG: TolC family protein [Verrucomicrobiota bacterium]|jgi:outer membrane protein TolC
MNSNQSNSRPRWRQGSVLALAAALLLTGCKGTPTKGEKEARQQAQAVAATYRPRAQRPVLPALTTNSGLEHFLAYAMLNQPQVEAAYFDWAASVEGITVERSLPDPQFTFQMDIANVVTSVMPGLMQEFVFPGKLRWRANLAAAESQAKYYAFESAVLQTALAVKRAYYQLWFLDEIIRINREMGDLLGELERSARGRNAVGKVTLQDVYRAQIEQDRLGAEIANLEDSRNPLRAQFKAALGLTNEQPDPPMPGRFEAATLEPPPEQLLATAFARHPRLKAMEADVRRAQASLALAYKAKVPDLSVGLMVDAQANPTLYRLPGGPATVSLPIWRDKIAAEIAGAQAGKRAAEARLTNEQIMLTVDFAMKSYDYREISRNLALLQNQLVPKAQKSLEIARSGYLASQIDFFNLIDAERTLLEFRLSEVKERTRRELVLAELSLLIAGVPPANSPTNSPR